MNVHIGSSDAPALPTLGRRTFIAGSLAAAAGVANLTSLPASANPWWATQGSTSLPGALPGVVAPVAGAGARIQPFLLDQVALGAGMLQ